MADVAEAMERAHRTLKDTPWLPLQPLGGGGGGDVFLCISRVVVVWFEGFQRRILERAFQTGTERRGGQLPPTDAEVLIEHLLRGVRTREDLAAVKIPHEGDGHPQRLAREVAAMRDYRHPALIRLLNFDEQKTPPRWFAMEAHLRGALAAEAHRARFLGQPLEILRAVRPIAEALAKMHAGTAVHRDVKPNNIFVADDERLILGDLGVVIPAPDAPRMTAVGADPAHSRDWVPDWVQFGVERTYGREVDVFALAKVIYFLLSGSNVMASQVRKGYSQLMDRFPGAPGLSSTVALLEKCIVTQEDDVAVPDGTTLVREIDALLGASSVSVVKGFPVFSFLSTSDHMDCQLPYNAVPGRTHTMPDVDELRSIPVHLAARTEALVARVRSCGVNQHGFSLEVSLGDVGSNRLHIKGSFEQQRPGGWTDPYVLRFDRPLEAGWRDLTVRALGSGTLTGLTLIYP